MSRSVLIEWLSFDSFFRNVANVHPTRILIGEVTPHVLAHVNRSPHRRRRYRPTPTSGVVGKRVRR